MGQNPAKSDERRAVSMRRDGLTRNRIYLAGMLVFVLVLTVIQFLRGGFIGPDTFLMFLLLGVIVMGQARTFLRDWTPFVLVFFGWQMLRGYADQAARGGGFKLHDRDLVAAERWLFQGDIPTVVLQHALYTPGEVRWYDVMATAFWAFHFVLPLLFAYLLWVRDRQLYWRFVYALVALSFAGFFTYVLFPAVPPWLAGRRKLILEGNIPVDVHNIRVATVGALRYGGGFSSWVMRNGNPNPIAAMPSLHAAYPTLVLLFTLFHWRMLSPIAALYCLGLWFSVIYIGDHYVIDVLAGILYAAITFFALRAVYGLVARRRMAHAAKGEDHHGATGPNAPDG